MRINRAYRTELSPDDAQCAKLDQHVDVARFAYNWGLRRKLDVMDLNRLPIQPIKIPSAIDLHRELNALKPSRFPWMYESSKCAPQEALRDLDAAFDRFFRGYARFPKFRSRKRCAKSFRLTGSISVRPGAIGLPRLGWIRLKENGYIPSRVHINSATLSERAGRWFVSTNVVEDRAVPVPISRSVVGVDRGLRALAIVSDGTVFNNPKALARYDRKLKHLQRAVSRRQKGSSNRRKAVAALSRLHVRITNVRRDALHKATSRLARTKSVIVVEDLRTRTMMTNRHLAKAIADVAWSEFVRQLEYKTSWYGSQLVLADRFYPSTKRCSSCGHVKDAMPLVERTYRCDYCGQVMDRDLNAAVNLSRWPSVGRTLETPVEGGVQSESGMTTAQPFCEAGTKSLRGGPNRRIS